MVNPFRGEVALSIGGRSYRLCLTLGALAEIETALGIEALCELEPRFERLSAGDLLAILGALMRGGGEPLTDEEVALLPLSLGEVSEAIARAMSLPGERHG